MDAEDQAGSRGGRGRLAIVIVMDYDDFIGEVINRLKLGSRAEGVRATRAVLTTLAERLQQGEATDLAGSLPMEIDYYVLSSEHDQRFGWDEFLERVGDRANIDEAEAAYYAQSLLEVVAETVPGGELGDLRSNLPEEFEELFELVDM